MTKKIVLWVSLAYVVYFIGAFLISEVICKETWCRIHDDDFLGLMLIVFSPLILVFLFSIITYKMQEDVFRAWWNFARWFVPVIMFVTFLIGFADTGGGVAGAAGDSFSYFILGVLYAIFVITSLVKIVRAYRGK